jgi:transcriptional regulator with XRE-family HTH domain
MPIQDNFAANFDRARKAAGLTLQDVATAAGTSVPYVHRVIACQVCPSLKTAEKLARTVNRPLSSLVRQNKSLPKTG